MEKRLIDADMTNHYQPASPLFVSDQGDSPSLNICSGTLRDISEVVCPGTASALPLYLELWSRPIACSQGGYRSTAPSPDDNHPAHNHSTFVFSRRREGLTAGSYGKMGIAIPRQVFQVCTRVFRTALTPNHEGCTGVMGHGLQGEKPVGWGRDWSVPNLRDSLQRLTHSQQRFPWVRRMLLPSLVHTLWILCQCLTDIISILIRDRSEGAMEHHSLLAPTLPFFFFPLQLRCSQELLVIHALDAWIRRTAHLPEYQVFR